MRELRNVLERAVILAGEGTIEVKHLPVFLQEHPAVAATGEEAVAAPIPSADELESVKFQIGTTVEEAEKGLILRALEHTKNNKTRAAEILGISLKTLHNKLKEYGGAHEGPRANRPLIGSADDLTCNWVARRAADKSGHPLGGIERSVTRCGRSVGPATRSPVVPGRSLRGRPSSDRPELAYRPVCRPLWMA